MDLGLKIVYQYEDTFIEVETRLPIQGLHVNVRDDRHAKWNDNGIDLEFLTRSLV